MKKVAKEDCIFAFSPNNQPVLTVSPGEQVHFELWDALCGQYETDETKAAFDWERVNPATGPVYIEGAEEGDILSVTINKINIAPHGVALCGKGMGVMGNVLEKTASRKIAIEGNEAIFSEKIRLPLNKMIGVIGTAPKDEDIRCGVPDHHGGNMDCKEITEGATVYLPVYVKGALLAMGDLHAVMADGEIGVTGVEVSGSVIATINVIKAKKMPLPMLENDLFIMTLASHVDLDVAVEMAVANMVEYLEHQGFDKYDATMLISLIADVRICQVVDPKKTARVEFPKKYLSCI